MINKNEAIKEVCLCVRVCLERLYEIVEEKTNLIIGKGVIDVAVAVAARVVIRIQWVLIGLSYF